MSQESFLKFLWANRDSPAMLARYSHRNLAQVLFHAKNQGFDFTAADAAQLICALENSVVHTKDRDTFTCSSRLWTHMWGKPYLEYLIEDVVARHTDQELWSLLRPTRVSAA